MIKFLVFFLFILVVSINSQAVTESKTIETISVRSDKILEGEITAFSPDGQFLFYQTKDGAFMYGVNDKRVAYFPKLNTHNGFKIDGNSIFGFIDDKKIIEWNMITGKEIGIAGEFYYKKKREFKPKKGKEFLQKALRKDKYGLYAEFSEEYKPEKFPLVIGNEQEKPFELKGIKIMGRSEGCEEKGTTYAKYKGKGIFDDGSLNEGGCGHIFSAIVSKDKRYVFVMAVSEKRGEARLVDLKTGKIIQTKIGENFELIAFTPNSKKVILRKKENDKIVEIFFINYTKKLTEEEWTNMENEVIFKINNNSNEIVDRALYRKIIFFQDENHLILSKEKQHSLFDSNGVYKGDLYFTPNGKIFIKNKIPNGELKFSVDDAPDMLRLMLFLNKDGKAVNGDLQYYESNLLMKTLVK